MVTNLARGGDALEEAEVADEVDGEQAEHVLPAQASDVLNAVNRMQPENLSPGPK